MSKTKLDIITALAETFGRKLSEPALKLYIAALGGLSDEQATRAATVAVQSCKFMPAAAELIELAKTGGVSYEAQALIAFDELDKALSENKPSLMSPLTRAVSRSLGDWGDLREMPLKEFATWKRKDFIAAYTALVRENPERIAALAGPNSDIAQALVEGMIRRLPTREENAKTEDANRQKLLEATQ